jgi:hypothetical protein
MNNGGVLETRQSRVDGRNVKTLSTECLKNIATFCPAEQMEPSGIRELYDIFVRFGSAGAPDRLILYRKCGRSVIHVDTR